ncbi:MAG: domain S-box [Thermoleophilia bacterium]|nr:domain S-box [Thermoleophilia bacterium]
MIGNDAAEAPDTPETPDEQRRELELLAGIAHVFAEMSAAATPDEVASVMLSTGLRALRADAGFLAIVGDGGETLRVSRFAGYEAVPAEQLELPIDANLPIAHAVRRGTPLFVGSNERLLEELPGVSRLDPADHACASIPLVAIEGQPALGAINVRYDTPREFSTVDRALLTALGQRCAEAMARAQRYADERRRRHDAEAALSASRALEINDDVIQLLVEAKLAMELGLADQASDALDSALEASKRVVAAMTIESTSYRRDAGAADSLELVGVRSVDVDPA